MKNEPVAYVDNVWINRPDLAMELGIGQMFSRCQLSDHQIPLYTHPVKELTLSPEKIIELQAEYGIDSDLTCHSVKDFVLAILRKAQEK